MPENLGLFCSPSTWSEENQKIQVGAGAVAQWFSAFYHTRCTRSPALHTLDIMAHASNSSTWVVDVGGSVIQDHPQQHEAQAQPGTCETHKRKRMKKIRYESFKTKQVSKCIGNVYSKGNSIPTNS